MADLVMEVFPEIDRAIEQERMLDAWGIAEATGVPFQEWPAGEPLRQASRLADALGASRLGRMLRRKNWRLRKEDPACFYGALFSRCQFVPFSVLRTEVSEFMARHPGMTAGERADLLSFQSWAFTRQRDFGPARRMLDEAIRLQPDDAWLRIELSSFHEAADQYEEALEAAQLAVAMRPHYRAAVTRCSDALIQLGRDDEALELLTRVHAETQQAAFPLAMQAIYSEREDHERALWCLDEFERLSPLMQPSYKEWLASRRADFHLLAGRLDAYLEHADQAGKGFKKKAAEKLRREGAREEKRKRLDVSFVRQHQMTCAPATLAAVAAFWGQKHDHLEIADAICYNGTPWHKERSWAEQHGFITKEFKFTRDSLRSLVDRGIPFTLTTQWTTGAHLQACIGYDARVDFALIRDPTNRHYGEMAIDGLMESHQVSGPRAMVLVPADRSDLLDGVPLEDELVYDSVSQLHKAIETRDEFQIDVALVGLRSVAPDHLQTLDGELRVAMLREDWQMALGKVDRLLERVPEDESLWLTKCTLLHNLRRMPEYRAALEKMVATPGADPVFVSDLGELLVDDARELVLADYYLRRAMLRQGGEARVYENLARCRLKQHRFDEAVSLRRAASCLAPTFEPYAYNYFDTTRITGKTAEGLDYLRERADRLGAKAHGPWITLAQALDSLYRSAEAAEVLERAIAIRPDDGLLALHGGRLMTGWGPEFRARGLELMAGSRGRVDEAVWLKESAETAGFLGERRVAIRHWKTLLASRPSQIWIWRNLARLVAEEEGRLAAISLLEEGTTKYPDFAALWSLSADWLAHSPQGPLAALDRYLELEPKSAWGFRERALRRGQGDPEGALSDAIEAVNLEPMSPVSRKIHGWVLEKLGRTAEAAEEFRKAISLSVDEVGAAVELMDLSLDRTSARQELDFIEREMRRQVSDGSIVPEFQRLAWRWIEPPALLEKLRGFCQMRPDLWQTWSARIDQAMGMDLHEEALKAATTMCETFPLLPRAWMDLAKVHEAAGNFSAAVEATSKALEISPGWDEASRAHADALELDGKAAEAEVVLRKAVQHEPLNGANHGCLADLLRRAGRNSEALDLLRSGLRICPFYGWGWTAAAKWSIEDGRAEEFGADITRTTEAQGHHRSWWPIASEAWSGLGHIENAINAIRRALELSPGDASLRDQLAHLLVSDGRIDEALAACAAQEGEEHPPTNLSGRRAWILMRTGQPVQAIKEMRELLDRQPDYIWGLGELTSWLSQRNDWSGTLEIAKRWARQSPQDCYSHGFVGQAEEQLSHPDLAEKSYARAFMLQPTYRFAGRQLIDLQMKAGRFEEAAETLRRLQYYTPDRWVACDAVELQLRMKNPALALKYAESLLDHPEADSHVMEWLKQLFKEHGSVADWMKIVERRLEAGNVVAPGALAASIGRLAPEKFAKKAYAKLKRQAPGTPARIEGWRRMIELTANLKDNEAIAGWAKNNREELMGNPVLWRAMSEAFLTVNDSAGGITWMAGWKDRQEDLTAGVLLWYAAMCDNCMSKRPDIQEDGIDARRMGLKLFPNDTDSRGLRAGLAFHLAVCGDIRGAKALLTELEAAHTAEYYQNYAKVAEAVIAAAEGDEAKARKEMVPAVAYFGQFTGGSVHLINMACDAVASRLPWTKGKAKRLRKAWNLQPSPTKAPVFSKFQTSFWPWAIIFLVINALVRSCTSE